MKVKKKHIRLISYTTLSAALSVLVLFVISAVFGIQHYDLRVDDRIVPALNAELAAHVQNLPLGVRVTPNLNAEIIQKQFPWIKSVSFFRIPTKTMQVAVALDEPHIRVNGAIITEQSQVIPASTFVPAAIAMLPALQVTFTVSAHDTVPDDFTPHARTFTEERFSPYTISWIDEYNARLTDKEQPQFIILFNAKSIPDAAMFAHCSSIKQLLQERGSFGGRKKDTRWVADIRFERQVIVFSEDKGVAHG
jgi:hypothetical protein